MPCYHPRTGYRSRQVNKSGKRSIVFNHKDGYLDLPITLPCGQCIGCRLERSRQWAVRCIHEASLHQNNCFITLTFSDENLDPEGSLRKDDFQKFMKRLRKHIAPEKVRYFHCGEYGELLNRPHHHACLFGVDFPDRQPFNSTVDTSPTLEKLWPHGYSTIGNVTFESAAYVARYILQKVTGDQAEAYYQDRVPPYNTMSRRPGIAKEWYNSFSSDVYPDDFIVIRDNIKCKPPKFYDNLYDLTNPENFASLKRKRLRASALSKEGPSLESKEIVKKTQLRELNRSYEC